jgi:quercetin dioxygenase-like cupin family protein
LKKSGNLYKIDYHPKEKKMLAKKYDEVKKEEVTAEGAEGVSIRWLIGKETDAPFYLRHFEVRPGGRTPYHNHPWEHEVYVLEGNGQLNTQQGPIPLEKGSFALVSPDEEHQFENTGTTTFAFLCAIPDTEKK